MTCSPGGVRLRSAVFGGWIGTLQSSMVASSIDSSVHKQTFQRSQFAPGMLSFGFPWHCAKEMKTSCSESRAVGQRG